MKSTKKLFIKRLRRLNRKYQNEVIAEAASKAEIDRDAFWKLMKRMRSGNKSGVSAIIGRDGKVVYEVDQILNV